MNFWRFTDPASLADSPTIAGEYDIALVMLSIVLASLSGITALQISSRIHDVPEPARKRMWLIAGATAMGCGIWSMHFTAMLAYAMPIPMHYNLALTLLSLVPAILGSAAALYCMSRPSTTLADPRLQLGALLMAVGIGSMHYTGMEAMRMPAQLVYSPFYFALSLVVAHLLAMIAIYTRSLLQRTDASDSGAAAVAGGILMGLAVAGMHYTAMYAASFYQLPNSGFNHTGVSHTILAAAIGGFIFLVLALTILVAWAENFKFVADLHSRHNVVTGLYNRSYFTELLEDRLEQNHTAKPQITLIIIGLDNFKSSDSLVDGRIANAVLQQSSRLLQDSLPDDALLGHLTGDEFAIALNTQAQPDDARALVNVLLDLLETPVEAAGRPIDCRAHAGLSNSNKTQRVETLIIEAQMAMRIARRTNERCCIYSPELIDRDLRLNFAG